MATTGTLVEWLAAGVTTTAGVAVASGKVRFYQPGTLTPQSVYSDSACTSAIPQPVTLSAGGTSVVYTNASVRMIVKDSIDTNTLFDVVENVQRDDNTFVTSPSFNSGNEVALSTILDAWATTGGGGSTVNFGYKPTGAATDRSLKGWMSEVHISVKDFGAVGDGANNDTTAIQAAITFVSGAGGGIVYFPPGTYLINASLTCTASGVSFFGAGALSSVIKNSGGATNALTMTSAAGFVISDLGFAHSSSGTATAIQLASCGSTSGPATITRVATAGHRTAIGLTGSSGNVNITNNALITPNTSGLERGVAMGNTNDYCVVADNYVFCGGIGIELTSSGGSNVIRGNYLGGTGPSSFQFNSSYSGLINTISGNRFVNAFVFGGATSPILTKLADNQGIEGNTTNVTSGGSYTPDRSKGTAFRIVGTTTGAAYTLNAPIPTPTGSDRNLYLNLIFFNNAGGPLTAPGWIIPAAYHLTTGLSVNNLDVTTLTVKWDPDTSVWREVSRAVSA